MIDTIGFKILIDRETYEHLINAVTVTQRRDNTTGEIMFEYYNGHLEFSSPSWNYTVLIRISEEYWAYNEKSRRPYKASGVPHLSFEYSVPKILFGTNVISADPCLIYLSMHVVRESFEKQFSANLPDPNEWYCYRLDTCANYLLENGTQVKHYINYLQRLNYPRRIKNSYEDTGLYFASRHSTLKVYWKGPEFKKHDQNRIKSIEHAADLCLLADSILRIEVEHKKRIIYITKKYESDNGFQLRTFQGYPRMADFIKIFDLKKEMSRIVANILCGTQSKVMTTLDALSLLSMKLSARQARAFHQVYMLIVTQGQKEAKKVTPEGTYYRATRALRECGISLIVSDSNENGFSLDRGFPADFSLEMHEDNKYYQIPHCDYEPAIDNEERPF